MSTVMDFSMSWYKNKNKSDDRTDRFYIALFSALEQTHCAVVARVIPNG